MENPEKDNIEASASSTMPSRGFANPNALGFGAFATTLLALSLSAIGFRGVSNQSVLIGNLCFLAGIGLLISAQWEMARGNTFGYTVLAAFGLYYGGYGVLIMPAMGIRESYQGQPAEYYNAFGIYQLVWCILNLLFFVASWSTNVPNIIVYGALELSYIFNCVSYFARADGNIGASTSLMKVAGVFGCISSLAGFYLLGYELCQDSVPFRIPVFPTSHLVAIQKSNQEDL